MTTFIADFLLNFFVGGVKRFLLNNQNSFSGSVDFVDFEKYFSAIEIQNLIILLREFLIYAFGLIKKYVFFRSNTNFRTSRTCVGFCWHNQQYFECFLCGVVRFFCLRVFVQNLFLDDSPSLLMMMFLFQFFLPKGE